MLQTILGALGTTMDGLSALILAVTLGFAAFPTALAYITAIIGMLVFGQVVPLSSPSEVIILASRMGKNRNERQSIIVYAGLTLLILGVTGTIGMILEFVGTGILSAMMAGVGIMLCQVSVGMVREKPLPGFFSLALAIITYLLTSNLVYTVTVSVFGTAILWYYINPDKSSSGSAYMAQEKLTPTKLTMNTSMIRGVLAVLTLQLGGAISNTEITASLAGTKANVNAVIGYMGVGNILSGFFGGSTVGPIISGTATTPNPQVSALLFMVFLGSLAIFRIVPRIMRYVPSQGIAGLLMVLSLFVIFPNNATSALADHPVVAAITMLVTAAVDPFFGMCAGVLARFLFSLLGM